MDPDIGRLTNYMHATIGIDVLMPIGMRTPIPIARATSNAYVVWAPSTSPNDLHAGAYGEPRAGIKGSAKGWEVWMPKNTITTEPLSITCIINYSVVGHPNGARAIGDKIMRRALKDRKGRGNNCIRR